MFDRLGSILRSYLDDDGQDIFSNGKSHGRSPDPDYQAAYDELNDYLNDEDEGDRFTSYNRFENKERKAGNTQQKTPPRQPKDTNTRDKVPTELYRDFIRLGLKPGASLEHCKKAHKNLLKQHHPDKHAGNPFTLNRATEMSSSINASFQRISYWYKTGRVE
ncbi:MAG: J domain-containing protein [Spirochaetaceae bacterium]|jgi:hypothetical protein|nr:J domain-containing protein [Spirochaetaceae bacterium]